VERDNKCRETLGLKTPTLEELRANCGVKVLRGSKRKDLLIRLGVIVPKRRSSSNYNNRNSDRKKRFVVHFMHLYWNESDKKKSSLHSKAQRRTNEIIKCPHEEGGCTTLLASCAFLPQNHRSVKFNFCCILNIQIVTRFLFLQFGFQTRVAPPQARDGHDRSHNDFSVFVSLLLLHLKYIYWAIYGERCLSCLRLIH